MNKIEISIKTPCSENPQNFRKTELGGFCNKCQKEVVDFSGRSQSEIYQYFKNREGAVCGKFNPNQLGTVSESQKGSNFFISRLVASTFGLFSILSARESLAQSPTENIVVVDELETEDVLKSKVSSSKKQETKTVSGKVVDVYDHQVLPGVNVILKGSRHGVSTNIKGIFSIELSEKEAINGILILSFIGFETKEVSVSDININHPIGLVADVNTLGDVCYKRPFPSNIWHWISRPFRR
jgi:hypothetical protein